LDVHGSHQSSIRYTWDSSIIYQMYSGLITCGALVAVAEGQAASINYLKRNTFLKIHYEMYSGVITCGALVAVAEGQAILVAAGRDGDGRRLAHLEPTPFFHLVWWVGGGGGGG
jgi:hypothetical protein